MLRSPAPAFALVVAAGCTSVLGIDGKYVLEMNQDGGTAGHGGSSAGGSEPVETGGVESTGGAGAGGASGESSSGGASTGGVAASCDSDGHACPSGQKCCAAPQQSGSTAMTCVDPAPIVGCDALDCKRCPSPPNTNAVAVCNAGACDFECNPGFTRSGTDCVPNAAGGASGTGGAPAPTCTAKNCPGCSVIGPFGCCRNNGTCGCTYAPGQFCL